MKASLPYAFARANGVLLTTRQQGHPQVLLHPDAHPLLLGEIRRHLGEALHPVWVDGAGFERALAEHYGQAGQSIAEFADDMDRDVDIARLVRQLPPVEDLLDSRHDAPIIRMINALLTQAVREQASDVHVEAFEHYSAVRFRLDGIMRDVIRPNPALHAAMVSRIKIMSSLDIAEKRLPQDGRISVRVAGRAVDVRVSTLPTHHGERIVLRLLDKSLDRLDLTALGMAADTLTAVDRLIHQPHGIFLVTGPTGSGKTTTLYAALSRLDAARQNIMTVEDPVEYDLPGIGQTQVNPRIALDFASALRSILRQDPDVVMIGEIRDLETAQIAIQASLTGHLVLATLHTNDAASAVTRLVDMGIEPFLLASGLHGVLAQRLLRRLCPHCREACLPDRAEMRQLQLDRPQPLFRPRGCAACFHTGYQGRIGIYELLEVRDDLRPLIHEQASDQALRAAACHTGGLRLLREDGMRRVLAGDTALEELLRVTRSGMT